MKGLRPALGLFRLQMRLNRLAWIENVAVGIALPLGIVALIGASLPESSRIRLLLGGVLLSQAALIMRRICLFLAASRFDGRSRLLDTTSISRLGYWIAYFLTAASLSLLPLVALGLGWIAFDLAAPSTWSWLGAYGLTGFVIFGIAVGLASMAPNIGIVGNLFDLFMAFHVAFCPLLYSGDRVPAPIRAFVFLDPLTLSAETMNASWSEGSVSRGQMGGLILWAASLVVVSVISLRRERLGLR